MKSYLKKKQVKQSAFNTSYDFFLAYERNLTCFYVLVSHGLGVTVDKMKKSYQRIDTFYLKFPLHFLRRKWQGPPQAKASEHETCVKEYQLKQINKKACVFLCIFKEGVKFHVCKYKNSYSNTSNIIILSSVYQKKV